MANLTATSAWSDVLQLETTHQAIGGAGGTMNLQAQSLINRTQYLADNKFNTADFLTTLKTNLNASGTAPVYAVRAWVNFNGKNTPTTNASGNISSITDNGVGNYTLNFTTALPHANYSVSGSGRYDTTGGANTPIVGIYRSATAQSTSAVQISTMTDVAAAFDCDVVTVTVVC